MWQRLYVGFFRAAAVVLLPACSIWAQDQGSVKAWYVGQQFEARTGPAKAMDAGELASKELFAQWAELGGKGYLLLGTVGATQPADQPSAEATKLLDTVIFKRAAEAGGDVVLFATDGVLTDGWIPTGKTRRVCAEGNTTSTVQTRFVDSGPSGCWTDAHFINHCSYTGGHFETQRNTITNCSKWKEEPVLKKAKVLESVGSVWRYDPKLVAEGIAAGHGNGWTPLHGAARQGQKDVAESLIAQGADVNAIEFISNLNGEVKTPLHYAVEAGHLDVAELLIVSGADVNAKSISGFTPLHLAAVAGRQDMVELLLAHQADVNAVNNLGRTPLGTAKFLGHLLRKDHRFNFTGVEEVLRQHGGVESPYAVAGAEKFHDASASGDLKKVDAMLKDNPNLIFSKGSKGETPLHMAALNDRRDVTELLLAKGADVNARDKAQMTPLHLAAEHDHTEVAELLLANKAEVNAQQNDGETPLHLAVGDRLPDMVVLLLTKGANVNARDSFGNTPLHYAVVDGDKDMADLLLTKGADVNARNGIGGTPLHLTAAMCTVADLRDVADLLLAKGADVNAKDSGGLSPSLWATAAPLKYKDPDPKTLNRCTDMMTFLGQHSAHP